jgi:hypothetical protein
MLIEEAHVSSKRQLVAYISYVIVLWYTSSSVNMFSSRFIQLEGSLLYACGSF